MSADNLQYTVEEIICDVEFFLSLSEVHLSAGFAKGNLKIPALLDITAAVLQTRFKTAT